MQQDRSTGASACGLAKRRSPGLHTNRGFSEWWFGCLTGARRGFSLPNLLSKQLAIRALVAEVGAEARGQALVAETLVAEAEISAVIVEHD